jgi:hypothetical protein
MQFQVPQFIETEDRVVGPLTFKQFGYVGIAATIVVILYFLLNTLLWIFTSALVICAAVILAFFKVNGRPISILVKALFSNIWKPSVYVFKPADRDEGTAEIKVTQMPYSIKSEKEPVTPRKTETPLFGGIKNLREWLATSKTAIPKRENPLPRDFGISLKKFKERYEVIRHLTGEREVAKRIDYR